MENEAFEQWLNTPGGQQALELKGQVKYRIKWTLMKAVRSSIREALQDAFEAGQQEGGAG